MKLRFTEEEQATWDAIMGSKGFLAKQLLENSIDILDRILKLQPRFLRLGLWESTHKFVPYTRDRMLEAQIPKRVDNWGQALYFPEDCAAATGSAGPNWVQWANVGLDFGRKDHPLAPKMRPPEPVLSQMDAEGLLGDRVKVTRFLSLELVLFFLCAHTRTWDEDRLPLIKEVRRRLALQHIPSIPLPVQPVIDPNIDGDLDDLFVDEEEIVLPEGTDSQEPKDTGDNGSSKHITLEQLMDSFEQARQAGKPLVPKVPKAGQALVGYNPNQPVRRDTPSSPIDLINLNTLNDDQIDAALGALQALKEKREQERAAQIQAKLASAKIEGGSPWLERGVYGDILVSYEDGTKALYIHSDWVALQEVPDSQPEPAVQDQEAVSPPQ